MCIVHQYYQKPCSKMWFESQYCYIHSMDLSVKFALLQMARAHLVEKCTLWVSIVTFKAYLSTRKLCTVHLYCYILWRTDLPWPWAVEPALSTRSHVTDLDIQRLEALTLVICNIPVIHTVADHQPTSLSFTTHTGALRISFQISFLLKCKVYNADVHVDAI